ncbi:DUF6470 family protein [Gracilibacillus sp. YIM 98692]|uniref:DUF6470 family protein n=1 Tax=Gracilibacillus sp. YIM 98692 TaxID=2663532 RepID=UPI0013D62BE3|nr:DUF6470 family protein [Gracilibacillus sp. YIM 98692]
MQIPQLHIQSQQAKIGIQTRDAQVSIDAGPAQQTIRQPEADLSIQTKPGKLTIDQSKALADVGIIPTEQSIKQNAEEAKQTAIEGVKKRRRQGDELMKIENGGNPLARQAKINGERPEKQFNIGWIPSWGGVDIDYQPAEVEISAKAIKPQIDSQPTETKLQYTRGSVDTYLEQKNQLEIDFENVKYVGINFETEI